MSCSSSGQYVYALTPSCPSTTSDRLGNACTVYGIYRSVNNGAFWNRMAGAQALNWRAIATSTDGSRVVAAAAGNGVRVCMDDV